MPLTVERTSPTTLTVTRRFAAAPDRVWAAHMEPALLQRWCFGPDGWSMPVCENDPRPGGAMRYEWVMPGNSGQGFHLTGRFEVVEPPENGREGRTVHVERMHLPDPTPENRVETIFAPDGTGTLLTMIMSVGTPETMDRMVASGMTDGMESGYVRIDAMEREAA